MNLETQIAIVGQPYLTTSMTKKNMILLREKRIADVQINRDKRDKKSETEK